MSGFRTCRDMMDRIISAPAEPRSIISLVPSQTELLYDLGLDHEVSGITKFCVHPEKWFRSKTRVGGTKKLHMDRIAALKPDLVIANKEENTQSEIEYLCTLYPVWISDVRTLSGGLDMIRQVGILVGREAEATALADNIRREIQTIRKPEQSRRAAYFIWKDPWMSVGQDTFIHDMLLHAGWENVYAHKTRYPETSLEELVSLQPELILLSSEPYPFREKHMAALQAVLPHAKILLVDGEIFSWYGSRMQYAASYINTLVQSLR